MDMESAVSGAQSSNKAILVVDDVRPIRELLRTVLEGEGCLVFDAKSVQEAYECWRANQEALDLCITDFHIGADTGQDLIDMVHTKSPGFPFLVVTAAPPEGGIRGAVRVIQKPFNVDEFLGVVRSALIPSASPQEG